MPRKASEPCQKYACAIQGCLKSNNYDEKKCEAAILAMIKCCDNLTSYSSICKGMTSNSNSKS